MKRIFNLPTLKETANPFYIFGFVWIVTLFTYAFRFSDLLPKLTWQLLLFLVTTCSLSFYLGYRTEVAKKRKFTLEDFNYELFMKFAIILIFIYFVVLSILGGGIPLISLIDGTRPYGQLYQIPQISFLFTTFSLFVGSLSIVLFLKRNDLSFLLYFLGIVAFFLLTVQRGMIVYLFAISVFSYFSIRSVSKRELGLLAVLGILFIIFFSIYGNIRSGLAWNNFDFLYGEWGLTGSLLPKWLTYPYMYITSPLGNLQNTINQITPEYSFSLFTISSLIPDFISNDLIMNIPDPALITKSLNVGSTYLTPYISMGYVGMILNYLSYIFVFYVFKKYVDFDEIIIVFINSSMCAIAAFTFFDNYITFSGLNFILAYPILFLLGQRMYRYLIRRLKR